MLGPEASTLKSMCSLHPPLGPWFFKYLRSLLGHWYGSTFSPKTHMHRAPAGLSQNCHPHVAWRNLSVNALFAEGKISTVCNSKHLPFSINSPQWYLFVKTHHFCEGKVFPLTPKQSLKELSGSGRMKGHPLLNCLALLTDRELKKHSFPGFLLLMA